MRNAPDITNVVEACNLDGRQERLENMLSQLELCEKALQVRARWALLGREEGCGACCRQSNGQGQTIPCAKHRMALRRVLTHTGLPGDQAHCVPALLLCGAGRPAGHPVQGLQPAAHPAPPAQELRLNPQPAVHQGRQRRAHQGAGAPRGRTRLRVRPARACTHMPMLPPLPGHHRNALIAPASRARHTPCVRTQTTSHTRHTHVAHTSHTHVTHTRHTHATRSSRP